MRWQLEAGASETALNIRTGLFKSDKKTLNLLQDGYKGEALHQRPTGSMNFLPIQKLGFVDSWDF